MKRPTRPTELVFGVRLRSWCVQVAAALVVMAYLYGLLRLQPGEWREFGIGIGIFAVAVTALTQWVQAWLERPVRLGLEAELGGRLEGDLLRQAFAGVVALPARASLFAVSSWGLALLFIPGWMIARVPDLHGSVLE